jgi:transposase-like protein
MRTNDWIKYGKTKKGQQRWRNKVTKEVITENPSTQPKEVKYLAIKLHLTGMSFRKCAEIVGVSPATVYNWFIKFGELIHQIEGLNVDTTKVYQDVEIDEMWHYSQSETHVVGTV